MPTSYTVASILLALAVGCIIMAILSERVVEEENRDWKGLTKAVTFAAGFLATLLAWHLPRGLNLMIILIVTTLTIWRTMSLPAKQPESKIITARYALIRLTLVLVCFAGAYASLLRTKDPSLFKPLFYIFIVVAAGAVHLFELSAIRRLQEGQDESAEERRKRVYRIVTRTIWVTVGLVAVALILTALS